MSPWIEQVKGNGRKVFLSVGAGERDSTSRLAAHTLQLTLDNHAKEHTDRSTHSLQHHATHCRYPRPSATRTSSTFFACPSAPWRRLRRSAWMYRIPRLCVLCQESQPSGRHTEVPAIRPSSHTCARQSLPLCFSHYYLTCPTCSIGLSRKVHCFDVISLIPSLAHSQSRCPPLGLLIPHHHHLLSLFPALNRSPFLLFSAMHSLH